MALLRSSRITSTELDPRQDYIAPTTLYLTKEGDVTDDPAQGWRKLAHRGASVPYAQAVELGLVKAVEAEIESAAKTAKKALKTTHKRGRGKAAGETLEDAPTNAGTNANPPDSANSEPTQVATSPAGE